MKSIRYSTVKSVTDNRPATRSTTWEKLVARLGNVEPRGKYPLKKYLALSRQERAKQKNGPGWIPGIFKPGGKRNDKSLRKLCFFVGDVDNNAGEHITLNRLRTALDGYEAVIHSTYSHSPDKPKFRFVVPLKRPIKPADHIQVFDHFNQLIGGGLDRKGKTPSQIYYFPSCPPGAEKYFECKRLRGTRFDVSALSPVKLVAPPPSEVAPSRLPGELPTVDVGKLTVSDRIKELIRTGEDVKRYASRSEAIFAVGSAMIAAGCSDAEIASVLLDENNAISGKVREQKKPRRYIEQTIRKVRGKTTSEREGSLILHRASDIEMERIDWIRQNYLARGKLTLYSGDPGLGKSQASIQDAAIVSTGGRWPEGGRCRRGSVLTFSAEDGMRDVQKGRLVAAGADLSKVHIVEAVQEFEQGKPVERWFNVKKHLPYLEKAARSIPDLALVIIDPISAYTDGVDSHNNADMRSALGPLTKFAEKYRVAVIVISHKSKAGGKNSLLRTNGSIALPALVRLAFLVTLDPDDTDTPMNERRRLLLTEKNNIGPHAPGLAFTVEPVTLPGRFETSRLKWDPTPLDITADEAQRRNEYADSDEDEEDHKSVGEWLRDALRAGPLLVRELRQLASDAGYKWRTLQRARERSGVIIDRKGFGKDQTVHWRLAGLRIDSSKRIIRIEFPRT